MVVVLPPDLQVLQTFFYNLEGVLLLLRGLQLDVAAFPCGGCSCILGGARTICSRSLPPGLPFFLFLLALTQERQERITVRALTFPQSPWPHVH